MSPVAIPIGKSPEDQGYESVLSQTVGPAALDLDAKCSITARQGARIWLGTCSCDGFVVHQLCYGRWEACEVQVLLECRRPQALSWAYCSCQEFGREIAEARNMYSNQMTQACRGGFGLWSFGGRPAPALAACRRSMYASMNMGHQQPVSLESHGDKHCAVILYFATRRSSNSAQAQAAKSLKGY